VPFEETMGCGWVERLGGLKEGKKERDKNMVGNAPRGSVILTRSEGGLGCLFEGIVSTAG
jgi:hypothetical protein